MGATRTLLAALWFAAEGLAMGVKSAFEKIGLQTLYSRYSEEILLCVIVAFIVGISPLFSPAFFTTYNIFNLLRSISFTLLPSLGQLMVIVTAGIDLSVGGVLRIVQLISVILIGTTSSALLTLLIALAAGTALGIINGLLVTKGKLEPFIVTLGSWTILDGVALLATGGRGISGKSTVAFKTIGTGLAGPIPYVVIVTLLCVVVVTVLLQKTAFGKRIYSVGDNEKASYYSGISVSRVKIAAYAFSGLLAAVSGYLLAARTGAFQPVTIHGGGSGIELSTIAAVVLGGARMTGGRGTVIGTVLGAFTSELLLNILVLGGVDPYIQQIVLALIILGALLISSTRRRLRSF